MKGMEQMRLKVLATILLGLSACVSTKSADNDSLSDDAVVQQVGSSAVVIGNQDRKMWLHMRTSSQVNLKMAGLLATGESEAAASLARVRLRSQPRDFTALSVLATALAMSKNFELSAYYAGMLGQYYPQNPERFNLVGLSLLLTSNNRMVQIRRAAAAFNEGFAGGSMACGLNLGQVHLDTGNAQAAESVFANVASRCHHCVDAMLGRGVALARLSRFHEAQNVFEEILADHPRQPEATYRLALVYRNGFNNSKKAIDLLDRLVAWNNVDKSLRKRAESALRGIQADVEVGNGSPAVSIDTKKANSKFVLDDDDE